MDGISMTSADYYELLTTSPEPSGGSMLTGTGGVLSMMDLTTLDPEWNATNTTAGAGGGKEGDEADGSAMWVAPLAERVVEASILAVIMVVAFLGNLLLWVVVLKHRSLRTASNALVLCLSAADLLVSSASMPVTITTIGAGRWLFSPELCTVLGFLTMCTFIGSVMSLAAISINRYILIVHPSRFKRVYTPRNTGFFIVGVWTLACILSLPPLTRIWARYGFLPNQSFCFCSWRSSISYTFFMVGVCFGGPCSVMTFCYVNILRVVRQSRKRVASNPNTMNTKRDLKKPGSDQSKADVRRPPTPSPNVNVVNSRQRSLDSIDSMMAAEQAGKTRAMLRAQLDQLIRAQTVAMARNDLTQNGQFDVSEPLPRIKAASVSQASELVSMRGKLQPKSPREIKWIVPERGSSPENLPGMISEQSEDDNSNRVNGVFRSMSAHARPPTERTSLTRIALSAAGGSPRKKQRKKNRSESEKRRKEEELKLTKSFLVVIFIFVLCWFPFCLTMFWSVFSKRDNAVPRPLDMGTLLLGYLNSCCNPIIYGVMNKRFRAGYKAILCGWRRRRMARNNVQQASMHLNTSTMGSLG